MTSIKDEIENEIKSLKTYLENNGDEIDELHKDMIEHQIDLKESYIN